MSDVIGHYIGGRQVAGTSGRRGDIYNPALGEVIRQVDFASQAEVRQAVEAAKAAHADWAAQPPLRRARVMFRLKQLLEANIEDLAKAVTEEHGKTIADAIAEETGGAYYRAQDEGALAAIYDEIDQLVAQAAATAPFPVFGAAEGAPVQVGTKPRTRGPTLPGL